MESQKAGRIARSGKTNEPSGRLIKEELLYEAFDDQACDMLKVAAIVRGEGQIVPVKRRERDRGVRNCLGEQHLHGLQFAGKGIEDKPEDLKRDHPEECLVVLLAEDHGRMTFA